MPNEKLLGTGSGQTTLRVAAAVLLVAVALLLVLRLPAGAQANDGDVSGVTLTSPNPGELVITWDAPGNAPDDYRVTWKKSTAKWPSFKNDNTVEGGNAFPTGTSHTVTGLEEGTAYKARVRARYHNSGGKVEKSGPWSVVQEVTVSATPAPTAQPPANVGRSTNPPAKPAGLLTAANHDSVLLSWTDPGDDSVTGYQVLRGPDADNLTTLVDDTGSATNSYTDDTVEAQTTYAYAVRGRNGDGLGPQSDPVTATTSTAPEEADPPTSARAIANAEFTLDGQDLDTSDSNCLEDNIGDITADCTINIDTTTVIFAVVGTLDSNDRLNVKIGRDKAAVDAASESADESDLRGTDQTVTLTFPVGRSLLRLWGDEDGSPGGSEVHFYRVNVRRVATIEAVKSPIVEGEEEVRFRIILSTQAPAGGVNVLVVVIMAGQGVLYGKATDELIELAELLQVPVTTTLLGKKRLPGGPSVGVGQRGPHPLRYRFPFRPPGRPHFRCRHQLHPAQHVHDVAPGKTLVQATNDPADINKDYNIDFPIVGDAKLVLRQMIEACREIVGDSRRNNQAIAREVTSERDGWLAGWLPKLTDNSRPINPYRVIWDFMRAIPPADAIVTHDSGSPRDQIIPFYRSNGPRTYLGWGKSHGLGTGLGLTIGAKLAQPDKVCVNFMGDAAFGMVGLDFETAVRSNLPIITVVLNNSTMAAETNAMADSHRLYNSRDLGGNYADMGTAMGGYAERIDDPAEVAAAFARARKVTEERGRAVLLEFITSSETEASHRRAF